MGRPASSFDSFREGPSTGLNYPNAVYLGDGSTQLQKPESEDSTLGFALIKFSLGFSVPQFPLIK